MVYKQDFTNVLELEIKKLEEIIEIIAEEIRIRESRFHRLIENPELDVILNKKEIIRLKGELASKNEFLSKLRDKQMSDTSELESEYEEMLKDYQSITTIEEKFEDPHEKLRYSYMRDEFLLWINKEGEHPDKKEASVFFYKGIKNVMDENGIKI